MNTYEQFRKIIDSNPARAPQSDKIIEILKILFTPEEIEVALHMSFRALSTERIAEAASLSLEETVERLESMAAKVIITYREKDGEKLYSLIPSIPGLFEFPFMRGDKSPMHSKLAKLWEEYHHEALGNAFSGNPTPLMRVVPVEKSFTAKNRAHPYEEVANLINNAKRIALAQCACRESVAACDAPRDVCLILDGAAKFLNEKGYARLIEKNEAMDVLNRSEEAGLVHTSSNCADKPVAICNCCPCCCTVLRGKTQLNNENAFATSRFVPYVIEESCTGCAVCADERCPVSAITMENCLAVISEEACIGCGLCVSGCPAEALELQERQLVPDVPATNIELGLTVAREKGTLEKFMEIMNRK